MTTHAKATYQQPTVNPTGKLIVRQKTSGAYTHEQFVRDVKKIGKPKRDAR